MARIDRLKEEIGWLKVVLGILVAVDASLIGWIVQNFATAGWVLVAGGGIAVLALTVALARENRLAYDRIKDLEDASWSGLCSPCFSSSLQDSCS